MNDDKTSTRFTKDEYDILDTLRKRLQKKYNVIIVYVMSRNYWYIENYKDGFSDDKNNYFRTLDEVEKFLKNNKEER